MIETIADLSRKLAYSESSLGIKEANEEIITRLSFPLLFEKKKEYL